MQQVHTKLHRLQGEGFAKNLTLQAHYVVQDDVINAVYENGHRLARAAAEMQQAGRLTLPFDNVLVEADLGWRAPTSQLPARTIRMLVWLRRAPPPAAAVARIYGFAHMNGQDVAFEHKHEVPTSGALEDLRGIEQDDDAMPRSIAANAFLFAALMANTRGIEKVPVEHCGLNRKRAASGKPPCRRTQRCASARSTTRRLVRPSPTAGTCRSTGARVTGARSPAAPAAASSSTSTSNPFS